MDDWKNVTEEERLKFWSRVAIKGPNECWLWTGATQKPGLRGKLLPYGWTRFRGQQMNTHRVAWMVGNDRRIPDGLVIRHSCHVPQCCNPAHLSPGTPKENAADTVAAGRHRPGNGLGRTADVVTYEEAKAMAESGAPTIIALTEAFDRSYSTIVRAFRKYGFELPNRRRSDDEWRAMAAHDLPGYNEYMRRFSVGTDSLRKHFTRLGLKLPAVDDPRKDYKPPYPDEHWIAIAAAGYPTLIACVRATGHDHGTIRKNLSRLGLPIPSATVGRPPVTNPINPKKGA